MAGTFDHGVSRRRLITGAGLLALGALTGCGGEDASSVAADSDAVRTAEQRRRRAGARVHHVDITAGLTTVDLGGPLVRTWADDGWGGPAEGLAGSAVEFGGDGDQLVGAVHGQVAALGEVLRSSPLVLSLVPRCQGLAGSQK